eukprot:CAMPEP_0194558410 /NCGR_PEP_ID=MMETSP0292-20121207/329_1 /TAXON_ID=39354 /ORGANISM="Heterosigma akashiwo, Strain CCMP2393" /LENGTH=380 /DNA_ID=CAMNT_0039406039 /DNA_START=21 /DNA_END=1163 /DNA_ORIENTATION=-
MESDMEMGGAKKRSHEESFGEDRSACETNTEVFSDAEGNHQQRLDCASNNVEIFDEDVDFSWVSEVPNDTLSAIMCTLQKLKQQAPASLPAVPVVLQHQIYALVKNRTQVDQELSSLRRTHLGANAKILMLQLPNQSRDIGVVLFEDYNRELKRQLKEAKECARGARRRQEAAGAGYSAGEQAKKRAAASPSSSAAAAAAVNLLPAGLGGETEGEAGGGNPLGFLRFHPQFRQIQAVVRENPALLQEVLARVGEDSPELLGMIHEHPEAFTQLLNEAPAAAGEGGEAGGAGEGAAGAAAAQMLMQMMAAGGEEEDDDMEGMETGGMMEGADVVELSAGEMEAVERLEALGFSKDACIEAFMACDKNEMLAANYLFENGGG